MDAHDDKQESHENEQAQQIALILESIPDAYLSVDQNWRCVYLNRAMEQLMRMRREAVLGRDVRELFADTDAARRRSFYEQAMNQRAAVTFESFYPSPGVWLAVRSFPNQNNGITICYRDVSVQKRTEQRLRESEDLLRLLNENLRDHALVILDVHGNVTEWNSGAARRFGFTEEEMQGQSIRRIFPLADQAAGASERELQTARDTGRAEDERWQQRKDGSLLWASGSTTALRDEQGQLRGFVKIMRDQTERKESEAALHRYRVELEQRVAERTAELEQANQALQAEIIERQHAEGMRKELMLQLVTLQEAERHRIARELHDQMGQQLAALSLKLKTLEDSSYGRAETLDDLRQLRGMVDEIGQEVHRLALDLRPTALDDLGLLPAMRALAGQWSEQTHMIVDFYRGTIDESCIPWPIATTIYRVVQEALTNVVKHAHARHVSLIVEDGNDNLVVIVEDDGMGFDIEALQARRTNRMGLQSMQERMALIGGTLTIETAPGSGTTVFARVSLSQYREGSM